MGGQTSLFINSQAKKWVGMSPPRSNATAKELQLIKLKLVDVVVLTRNKDFSPGMSLKQRGYKRWNADLSTKLSEIRIMPYSIKQQKQKREEFLQKKRNKKSKSCNEEKWGFAIINKRQAKKICTSVDFQQKENFKQW